MKTLEVYTRRDKICGCLMSGMGGIVYIPCTKCISPCPISQVPVKEILVSTIFGNVSRKEGS